MAETLESPKASNLILLIFSYFLLLPIVLLFHNFLVIILKCYTYVILSKQFKKNRY